MARRKKSAAVLAGAGEFAGTDTNEEAKSKIAAAEQAEEKKTGDNGGPPLDENAWSRACNEYVAEMLEMEALAVQRSEIAGRISSVRKVAKKLGVDWDVVKRYYLDHKIVRKGGMGAMVTEERRYRWLLKVQGSPLATQFSLWEFQEATRPDAKPGMDAELSGQHAYSNGESLANNPHQQGTEQYFDWSQGWKNAQAAKARSMAPNGAEAAAP